MIIDSHEHLMLPIEYQIKKLDEAGVDKVILFCTTPHPEKATTYEELKNEIKNLYKVLNGAHSKEDNLKRLKNNIKDLSRVLKEYPARFLGFGSVPLGLSLEETINWIKDYIIYNNLKGIGEFTPSSENDIKNLETVFKALEHFPNLPIWIHTFNPLSENNLKMIMNLTKKYSSVPVIYGHMGGSYWMELIDFVKKTPNAYIDLSAAFSTLAARMAITELPDKCIYSSDAPYGEPLLSKELIEFVSPSKEVTDKVLGGNISDLLGLK